VSVRPGHTTADMALLVGTSAVHLVFEDLLHAKGVFLAAAAVVWTWWLVRRLREEPGLFRAWGLSTSALRPALAAVTVIGVGGAIFLLGMGKHLGRLPLPSHFLGVALLYLPWALVQQVALNGILVRGLRPFLPLRAVPFAAALLFSLAHLPDLPLMALTFVAGLLWAAVFLRWPNLWALTLCHAFLGTLTYYTILGRDPWTELIAPLIHLR